MKSGRTENGRLPDGLAEDAWITLSMMGTFAAHDWYDAYKKRRSPRKIGEAAE
jgi:hypothetical protein